jgi:predicted DNA-binding transcriptional regulator AlpA
MFSVNSMEDVMKVGPYSPGLRLLTEKQAAHYLGVSVYLLQRWRSQNRGPQYVRVGGSNGRAIRYRQSALDAWIEINTVETGSAV